MVCQTEGFLPFKYLCFLVGCVPMGVLTSLRSSELIYLKPAHVFGRDPNIADSLLQDKMCSRTHFVIRWQGGGWVLLDESKNGCFINGVKTSKGQFVALNKKDIISASHKDDAQWQFSCDNKPKPVLVTPGNNAYIELDAINLLPDKDHPECQILQQGQQWYLEKGHDRYELNEGSHFSIQGQPWIFYPNSLVEETVYQPINNNDNTSLIFNVNRSEEHIQLILDNGHSHIDLGVRTHHYLLLEMARYALEDNIANLSEKGWMSNDLLLNNLRIDVNNLNIQIYRARKALSKHSFYWGQNLIERRRGEMRLHPCHIEINKA